MGRASPGTRTCCKASARRDHPVDARLCAWLPCWERWSSPLCWRTYRSCHSSARRFEARAGLHANPVASATIPSCPQYMHKMNLIRHTMQSKDESEACPLMLNMTDPRIVRREHVVSANELMDCSCLGSHLYSVVCILQPRKNITLA